MMSRKEYERILEFHKTKGFNEVDQAIIMCEIRYLIEYIEKVQPVIEAAKDALGTQVCDWSKVGDYSPGIKALQTALKALEE